MDRSLLMTIILLLALAGILGGCGEEVPVGRTPPTVVYEQLRAGKVEMRQDLPGRVLALRMAEVRPQVSGILRERMFEEGDEVVKGQPLYRIDDAPFRAAYNEAKAGLVKAQSRGEAARKRMERAVSLAKKHAVSMQERDDAVAAYKEMEAEMAAAREMLEKAAIELGYASIEAPISGRIGRSLVREGALLSESQAEPMAVINQLNPVYVDVAIPARQLLSLKKGQMEDQGENRRYAEVSSGNTLNGGLGTADALMCEIMFAETEADESTGTVVTRLKCQNENRFLLPGMFVRARLPMETLEKAIAIPQRSVGRDNRNRPVVYVLRHENGDIYRLEERAVELRGERGGSWIIGAGLEEGELLLVEGLQHAENGALVKGRAREAQER